MDRALHAINIWLACGAIAELRIGAPLVALIYRLVPPRSNLLLLASLTVCAVPPAPWLRTG